MKVLHYKVQNPRQSPCQPHPATPSHTQPQPTTSAPTNSASLLGGAACVTALAASLLIPREQLTEKQQQQHQQEQQQHQQVSLREGATEEGWVTKQEDLAPTKKDLVAKEIGLIEAALAESDPSQPAEKLHVREICFNDKNDLVLKENGAEIKRDEKFVIDRLDSQLGVLSKGRFFSLPPFLGKPIHSMEAKEIKVGKSYGDALFGTTELSHSLLPNKTVFLKIFESASRRWVSEAAFHYSSWMEMPNQVARVFCWTVFITSEGICLPCLVMEYSDQGSVTERNVDEYMFGPEFLTADEKSGIEFVLNTNLAKDLFEKVNNLTHNDLHLGNVLKFNSGEKGGEPVLKITDFGLAWVGSQVQSRTGMCHRIKVINLGGSIRAAQEFSKTFCKEEA